MPTLARRRPLIVLTALGGLALAGARASAEPEPTQVASPRAPAEVARQVDALMEKGWAAGKVTPRPAASDGEWMRRLSLDLTGSIPDEAPARAFLASQAPDKRAAYAREFTRSEGFARFTALRWAYLLVGREYLVRTLQGKRYDRMMQRLEERRGPSMDDDDEDGMRSGPVPPLVEWLETKIQGGAPWDQVVRELLAANGAVDENPAVHYLLRYARDGKAEEMTGSAMRVFQGLQVQCAQCHDHPYARWKQTDFYGVAAFFARTAARREKPPEEMEKDDKKKDKKGPYVVFERPNGQIRIPAPPGETGPLMLPRFLTGEVVRPGAGVDRRAELGRIITAPENPWFAKAMVNRMWSFLFGRGIIDPVDDLETAEYPHPEVLALLEKDFRESGHDLRRLAEVIVATRAYGLTSQGPEESREAELALFARAPMRSLSAEQLFYSVLAATGVEDLRDAGQRARLERQKFQMLRKFLQTFGDDEGEEKLDEGTIPQALLLLNGPLSNDAVRPRPGHPLYDRLFKMKTHDERIDAVWLRTLTRYPTDPEKKAMRELLGGDEAKTAAGQAQVWSDTMWALLNSAEFAFVH